MKLLITGGCGFLGSNLAAEALRRGYELLVFDNMSRHGSTENLAWLRRQGVFQHVQGDIRRPGEVARVVAGMIPDAVFHLAGQVAMTTSIADPRLDFETNALGSINLLEAVRLNAPEAAVIYSSSNKVYGDLHQYAYRETATRYECIDRPQGFNEDTPLAFRSPYGCSKGAADQYMGDYARIFGLKTVVFRHSSMYGGRQFATSDQGWVGWFCQKAEEEARGAGDEFTISGSGKQVRDVLHAEDMNNLYFSALDRLDAVAGGVFNIGGGMDNSLSLLELLSMLEELVQVPLRCRRISARVSDQKVFVANLAKVTRFLGWQPKVGSRTGVAKMLEWIAQTR